MRITRQLMGMPITIEIAGAEDSALHERAFAYFEAVDRRFSTYRADSEISAINAGRVDVERCSPEMEEVFAIAALTQAETAGYFDIRRPDGTLDPSGVVKGWAIRNAARLLESAGARDFYVDAGGDIQSAGRNAAGKPWSAGIRDPFHPAQHVKTIYPKGRGIATSGTYVRGQHIYDPFRPASILKDIVSLTVIGRDVLEADRFATAAFAMGMRGIDFIEAQPGLEAYQIDAAGIATMSSGFEELTMP
ncbi:MAG TPA: FAD:protein FMN transferase [Devosia sp.]|nr:FAD:protein FMN transferase [Devosia sp.]